MAMDIETYRALVISLTSCPDKRNCKATIGQSCQQGAELPSGDKWFAVRYIHDVRSAAFYELTLDGTQCPARSPQFRIRCQLPLSHGENHYGKGFTWHPTTGHERGPS